MAAPMPRCARQAVRPPECHTDDKNARRRSNASRMQSKKPLARSSSVPIPSAKVKAMRHPRALVPDLAAATANDVIELAESTGVRFLRLQFTDILGVSKNV